MNPTDTPRGILAQHQQALDQGQFLIQQCQACRQHIYYPREICPHCGHGELALVAPTGLGVVHAVSTVRRKAADGGDYNVSIVALDEGVRLMSRVEGLAPADVKIGLRVRVRVAQIEGQGAAVVDPVAEPMPEPPPQAAPRPSAPALLRASDPLRGRVAVAGVATFGCGEAPGFTDMEIMVRAARAAVADAGLRMDQIDGICTGSSSSSTWVMPAIEHLGIRPTHIDGTTIGGSSFIAHLLPAMRALESGQCNAVLVCYGSAQRTATFGRREVGAARKWLDPQPYEKPYAPFNPPSAYALAASRHMHQFGTTRRQLAEVAVAARAWARLNPEAFARDPLGIEEVLAARMVCDPFTTRDCCLVTDGGGAFVLVRSERARDLQRKPVYVLGNATALWNRQISSMHDLTVTAAQESGQRAFAMAGLQPRDIGVLQLYDAFTINPILFLEDLGFCAKGEGGAFVENGAIGPGGRLPVNTNGGGLSCVHPGMYGIFALIEAVRQLRGDCGERQVKDLHTALAHGNGGTLSSQSTAILGTEQAL